MQDLTLFTLGYGYLSQSSGWPHASEEDVTLTRRMVEACAPLDIKVPDHFLIAGTEVLSFKEKGWF